MAILTSFHYEFIKLKHIVIALICKNGLLKNDNLMRLLDIASNFIWKYTKPLEKEGLINSKKVGSNKLWGATPEGHRVLNDISTLLNQPIEYLTNLEANLNKPRTLIKDMDYCR